MNPLHKLNQIYISEHLYPELYILIYVHLPIEDHFSINMMISIQ